MMKEKPREIRMARFQVNLMRGHVMPRSRRKAVYWAMVLYLAACVAAVAVMVNGATRELVSAYRLRGEITDIEQEFRRSTPGEQDILRHSSGMLAELTETAAHLDVINGLVKQRVRLAGILRGIVAPLPPGVHLAAFRLDGRKRELAFDIVVPERDGAAGVNASQLTAAWNSDRILVSRLGRVRSVVSRRERWEGRPVFLLTFACAFPGGGEVAGGS